MAPETSAPSNATYQRSARAIGALTALVSLACAVLLAQGMANLAHHRIDEALGQLIVVVALRGLLAAAGAEWGDRVGGAIRNRWRRALPRHLTRPSAERDRSRGDLALAIEYASDAPALDVLATSAVVSLAGVAVVFWAAGWLSLVITVALLVLAVPFYQRAGRRSERMSIQFEERRALLESRQLELLHHTTELRALGAVAYGADEVAAISDSEHAIALRAIRVALESALVTEFLSGVSIGLVAMVVGFALLGGRISLEHALIAVVVTGEVFLNVRRYGTEFHRRENSARSIAALLDTGRERAHRAAQDVLVVTDLATEATDVGVSLRVARGGRVLVTGPSGSGKTTLLQTMVGWRPALRGRVERTGGAVGFVGVDSALLSGTLRDNLAVGEEVDDETLHRLLASLGLRGARFDDLDTLLLADGRGLSTGERVRLVLARALLAEPELVLLDDIAGVLDAGSRASVRDALEQRRGLAIVEATVDTPLMGDFDSRIEVTA